MKENDIRPETIFSEYLSLAAADVDHYFSTGPRTRVPCPACAGTRSRFQFAKSSFDYEECPDCGTLYANPRPAPDRFLRYYAEAPSVKYWATHFYKQTEEARRTLLIRPKAEAAKATIERYIGSLPPDASVIDIGAGYGVFCEELQRLYGEQLTVIAIEPSGSLAEECRRKGMVTIEKFLEDVTVSDIGGKKVIAAVSFELLEHLAEPGRFFSHCRELLPAGSLLILTTLSWDGFDLQVLREKSRSIQPPGHINFFTVKGMEILLRRSGFDVLEITTPGALDVDIVSKQLADVKSAFLRKLIGEGDAERRQKFQAFLQETNLSSHLRVVARRL